MIDFDKELFSDFLEGKATIFDLKIGEIQIGKSFREIPKEEIIDIYVDNKSSDGYNFSNSDFTLTERLAQLETNDGFIHLAGGLNCRIHKSLIADLRVSGKYIKSFSSLNKTDLIAFNRRPTFELVDDLAYSGFAYSIDHIILVYENKNVRFYLDPNELTLKEVNTNKLNLEHYRKITGS